MEPALIAPRPRTSAHRHTHPLVAVLAKGLGVVARGAPRAVLLCCDRVHRQVVVGMNAPRPNPAVVTTRAIVFGVARSAEPAVVAGHALVPLHESGIVLCVPQPARRAQHARGKMGLEPSARHDQVAGRTARGSVAAGGFRQIVAPKASSHPRHLIVGGQRELLDGTMALTAADVASGVRAVVDLDQRFGQRHALHQQRLHGVVAHMAEGTGAAGLWTGLHLSDVHVARAVTTIAELGRGHQTIGALGAGDRSRVALHAREAHREMLRVAEPKRNGLRGINRLAWPGVVQGSRRASRAHGRIGAGAPSSQTDSDQHRKPDRCGALAGAGHRVLHLVTAICSQAMTL